MIIDIKDLEIEMIKEKVKTPKGLRFLLENYSVNDVGKANIKVFAYSGLIYNKGVTSKKAEDKLMTFLCYALFEDQELFEEKYKVEYREVIYDVLDILTIYYKRAKDYKKNPDNAVITKIFNYKNILKSKGELQ